MIANPRDYPSELKTEATIDPPQDDYHRAAEDAIKFFVDTQKEGGSYSDVSLIQLRDLPDVGRLTDIIAWAIQNTTEQIVERLTTTDLIDKARTDLVAKIKWRDPWINRSALGEYKSQIVDGVKVRGGPRDMFTKRVHYALQGALAQQDNYTRYKIIAELSG